MAGSFDFVTLEDVLDIHLHQIQTYGGMDGLRDPNMLQSALAMPQAGFGGQFLHADLFEMAAAYVFHLIQNHPFFDGNKRTGLETALYFLEINGVETTKARLTKDELVKFVYRVGCGELAKPEIAAFLRQTFGA